MVLGIAIGVVGTLFFEFVALFWAAIKVYKKKGGVKNENKKN